MRLLFLKKVSSLYPYLTPLYQNYFLELEYSVIPFATLVSKFVR